MYLVFCDNKPLYDLRDESLVLETPVVKLAQNSAGTFEFTILPKHPQYDELEELRSIITVYDRDEEIFCGRIAEIKRDRLNKKTVYCESELAYLNDSIQRPEVYQGLTVAQYLQTLITIHNQQIAGQGVINKAFTLGAVTVIDDNDYVYKTTNYESTLEVIKKDLIDTYGGYLRIRKVNGVRYLDYLKDYPNTNTQVIRFGENLLDFTEDMVASDIATAVIPLGATLERESSDEEQEQSDVPTLEERLNIKDVNGGVDFVYSQSAVSTYGWIFKTVIWDDVYVPANLKRKGELYLSDIQFSQIQLNVNALDLHMMNVNIERIKILDRIRIVSEPNGLDRYFPVTEMTIQIDKPSNNTITLGTKVAESGSLTGQSSSSNSEILKKIQKIPLKYDILEEAKRNATELIKSATNGHVYITEGAEELLIMDTDDIETASKVWRWNLNGLGYSSTGYDGTYGLAMTMDGQIVGDRLVAGSVNAQKLSTSYKSEVERQIGLAESNAIDYTDDQLRYYWTRNQVETAIDQTADQILISAKETANAYTDNRLRNYVTSAQLKVKTDAIESTVSKKLNTSEFATKIQQNAYSVKIAWNNISKYIQFESGELRIYDSANESTQQLVAKFNYSGSHFYRDGVYLGKLGTNKFQADPEFKGLVFDMEYNVGYMCWAVKDTQDANTYTTKLVYYHQDHDGNAKGLHFDCPTYAGGNLYLSLDNSRFIQWTEGGCGFNGRMTWCTDSFQNAVAIDGRAHTFNVYNNVGVNFYTPINMNYYSIYNQSDARMKKNIAPSQVNALEILNAFDLKQFDWIQTGEHEKVGIIAQQLQLIEPDLVAEEQDGHLSIKTTKFIFYLIKAIQELCEGQGYVKTPWSDPYSLMEKYTFCAKLDSGKATSVPDVHEPAEIPVR